VKCGRTSVDDFLNKLGNSSTGSPLLGEFCDLCLGRNFASDEKPEESFWKRFRSTRCFGKLSLAFWNGLAAESNSFLCLNVKMTREHRENISRTSIENGTIPDEGGKTTHTTE